MKYGLQFRDVFAAWESLLEGVYITLLLSASAMLGGLIIGVACAAARVYGSGWLKRIVAAYVEIIRNTPLLVQIVRAGFEAVPKAQIEAGHSLGLSGLQVFRYVVVFPAMKAMYPALASQFVLLMLATSVVSQISVEDLFHAASIIQSRTFRDFEVYTVIGALYLGLAFAFRGVFAGIYYWVFARR